MVHLSCLDIMFSRFRSLLFKNSILLSWVCLVKDIIPEKEVNALLFSPFENFQGLIDVISNKVDTTLFQIV